MRLEIFLGQNKVEQSDEEGGKERERREGNF